ncbi:MAG: PAS domain S-box protein [Terriglobales bacterium]|jgi:diguanylate cyclase (GGDEF)-like protein/PAS domain S-box-containing protein
MARINDIIDPLQAQEGLFPKEERFRRILASVPDVAWTSDRQGRMIYISPKVEALFGYTQQEFCGDGAESWLNRIHAEDVGRVKQAFEALFEAQNAFDQEFRIRRKDESWIWVHDRATGIHEENGALCTDGILSDITRRKQVEAELQSKTVFLEAQANSTIDGVQVVDEHGQRIMQNRRLVELLRIPSEILADKNNPPLLYHVAALVKDPQSFLDRTNHLYRHPHQTSHDELEFKDGTILDRHSSPVVDQNGVYYGRVWTFRDITERRRNEGILRQLSLAVEQSPVAVVITDPQGNISYVNRRFTECTGYGPEEVVGKNPRILKSGRNSPDLYQNLWSTITQGHEWRGEFCNKKKNGDIYWEAVTVTPITNAKGTITSFLAVMGDITERRQAEEALKASEKRYRLLFERNLAGVFRTTLDGRILDCNPAAAHMFGYDSPEEVLILAVADLYHNSPDRKALLDRLKATKNLTNQEMRLRRKDGDSVWVSANLSLVDDDGADSGIVESTLVDVTERKRAEKQLRLMQFSLEHASDDVHWLNSEGHIVYANEAACRSLERSREELLSLSIPDIDPLTTKEAWSAVWEELRKRGSMTFEAQHKAKQGRLFPVEVTANYLDFDGQEYDFAFVRDITERKQAEEALKASEKRYRLLFERNLAGVFRTTLDGRVLDCNPAAARMFGYDSPEEVLVIPITDVYQTASHREVFLTKLKSEKSLTNQEVRFRRKDGSSGWAMLNVSLVDDDPVENLSTIEGTLVNITERKVAEEQVQSLAYYDALTGLPNRTLLQDRLSKALAMARRQKHKVALLFLDLDRFKIINDSLGHSVGDMLLQAVAERLTRCAREQDTVARLGGDEFLIVLTNVKDIPDAAVAAERFMDTMTAGFAILGHSLAISCSLGVSIFPEHGADSETLIKNADAAMYSAKDGGRNNFQFFTADMNAQAVERLTVENSLRLALERRELFLAYQPQMDIATGKITGVEALLRWQHPELGLVPPDKFIPIAENSGLIIPIGEWVLRTACSQARKWQDEGLTAVSVAVNVSAAQFRQEGFSETVCRVLRETGIPPQYLELELTESLLLSNADVMFSVLQQLTAMGLRLTIDDFGTGYSSLSYLKRFPVGKLKIDRSFVQDVAADADDAAITTAIISMAKSLNLKVIAEGVENEAQMSFLREHQCDEIQGYYFSKPVAAEEVADKLRANYSKAHVRAQASGKQS